MAAGDPIQIQGIFDDATGELVEVLGADGKRARQLTPAQLAQVTASNATQKSIGAYGTDRNALNTACREAAAQGFELVIDTLVTVDIARDPSKVIFLEPNTTIRFTPEGEIRYNSNLCPLFAIVNSSNVRIFNPKVVFTGSPDDNPATFNTGSLWNDTTLRLYLISQGVTGSFNGTWAGATQASAMFYVAGQSDNLYVEKPRFEALPGVGRSGLIPVVFSFAVENPRNAINGTTPKTIPKNFTMIDAAFDGTIMGVVGVIEGATILNTVSYRFGDYQASGGTLGGFGTWFAPPHLFYLNNDPTTGRAGNYVIKNTTDHGILVGGAGVRSTASGTCVSLKIGGIGNNAVHGYTSNRRDGFADFLGGSGRMSVRDVYSVSNSAEFAGAVFPAIRFPGPGSFLDFELDNVYLEDLNPAATYLPCIGPLGPGNGRVVIRNLKMVLQDFTGTAFPAFAFSGVDVTIDVTLILKAHTQTQISRGMACYESGNTSNVQELDYTGRIFGWRNIDSNPDQLLNRVIINSGNAPYRKRARITDTANGLVREVAAGLITDTWTRDVKFTPVAGAGGNIGLQVPANWDVVSIYAINTTAFGTSTGLTGLVLRVGATTVNAPPALTVNSRNFTLAVGSLGSVREVTLTPAAGTFDGVGTIAVVVELRRVTME